MSSCPRSRSGSNAPTAKSAPTSPPTSSSRAAATRRAVAAVKKNYRLGRVRVHRPWVTEPGQWLQYDFGDGPVIDGVKTTLFCAWLAWSRFRVVLAIRDKTSPSVMAALDVLRRLGGAPTYLLTDNEKTVTTEHVRIADLVVVMQWSPGEATTDHS